MKARDKGLLASLFGNLSALFRRPPAERVEEPENPPASGTAGSTPLDALPKQTLLGQGRYRVLSTYAAAKTPDEANVYTARGTTSLSRCPNCDAAIVGDEVQSCAHCGADLRGITLIYPKFLVRETIDAQTFELSAKVAALRLRHPALIVPEDVFTETAFDPPRYYRVEPVLKPARELSSPQPAERVLRWGVALAQGMAYLHQYGVALREIDLEHIVISHRIARYVCIDNVVLLPREEYGQADVRFTENVRALAGMLLALVRASDGALAGDASSDDASSDDASSVFGGSSPGPTMVAGVVPATAVSAIPSSTTKKKPTRECRLDSRRNSITTKE